MLAPIANLLVRKLDDDLVQRLKARARAHGRWPQPAGVSIWIWAG